MPLFLCDDQAAVPVTRATQSAGQHLQYDIETTWTSFGMPAGNLPQGSPAAD